MGMATALRRRSSTAVEVALGADERVKFSAADQKVKEALAAYEATNANRRSEPVPTEFLGAESASLTMPAGREPGCAFRILARRPLCCLLLIYLLSVGSVAGIFLIGDLNLTLQTELFEDQTQLAVQRQFLTTQLEYTDYSSYRNYARRQLYHQPATADEQKLQCDHSHNDVWGQRVKTYSIVYSTRDGSPLLSPASSSVLRKDSAPLAAASCCRGRARATSHDTHAARTKADTPLFISTTSPPAKSKTPNLFSQPPL